MFVKNEHGAYVNGQKLVMVIVSILIIVPAFGIGNVDDLVKWLVKLNAVCMPLRYLWVFVAYIALKKVGEKFGREYFFVRNKTVGIIFGASPPTNLPIVKTAGSVGDTSLLIISCNDM